MALGRWINSLKGQRSTGAEAKGQAIPTDLGAGKAFRNRKMLDQLSCTMELPRGTELEHPP